MCCTYEKRPMKIILLTIIIFLIFIAGCNQEGKYREFAECLGEKGITMYGENSCPHCKEQKYLFGDDFKYVPYIECANTPQKCTEAQVKLYPTWINSQGEQKKGVQRLNDLATWSGCSLP